MQETIVKKSKHAGKLAQIENLVAQGMSGNAASKKVGLHPQIWYTFQSRIKKFRRRRSRTLGVQEVTLPEVKTSSPTKVFAFVGSTEQISEILRGLV